MKIIEGFNGKYGITEDGQVYSFAINAFLQQQTTEKGYHTIKLGRGNNYKTYRVHRLVAQAYIPNPDNLPEVNHIDEDKSNNHVSNLEWCTQEYNLHYGSKALLCKPVYCIELDKTFSSAGVASKELSILDKGIRLCCKGRSKTAGGYHWKYV